MSQESLTDKLKFLSGRCGMKYEKNWALNSILLPTILTLYESK